jgi:hypothetical protein
MIKRVMNIYFRWPIFFDVMLSIGASYQLSKYLFECDEMLDRSNLLSVISSLVSTCVSLAGFILAALTIIITFKSNLKAKGIAEADDAMELILSSKHYESIVSVFKTAIIEFVIITIALYLISAASSQFTISALSIVTINGIVITSLTIWRSLFVLFRILKMEKRNIDKKRS